MATRKVTKKYKQTKPHKAADVPTLEANGVLVPTTQEAVDPALSEVVPVETHGALIGGISTNTLRSALREQTEQRKIIKEFVKGHLEEGTDYGRIHVLSKDKCSNQYNCKIDYHFSKPVLFKPGQEKLFSLFQITATLERDAETYTMLPDTKGLVAYKCVMYRNGVEIGEGRGSAVVGDSRRDANATIKIAEKRARMDACLSLGFSEYFAQDLDDPDYKEGAEMARRQAEAKAEALDKDEFGLWRRDTDLPIDAAERAILFKLIKGAGYTDKEDILNLLRANNIEHPEAIKSGQARVFMKMIKQGEYQAVPITPKPVDDVVADIDGLDLSSGIDETLSPESPGPKASVPEPEIVVDRDFKHALMDQFITIGLNTYGKLWFFRKACGRPYGDFSQLTDEDWRRAYILIQDIDSMIIELPTQYLEGPGHSSEEPVKIEPAQQV